MAEPQQLTIVLTAAEEGGYTVTCPGYPGLVTEGEDVAGALEMAAGAWRELQWARRFANRSAATTTLYSHELGGEG